MRNVSITDGANFPDALSATNIATGGILLTTPTSLPEASIRILDEHPIDSATIVGGPASVSPAVESQVERLIDK